MLPFLLLAGLLGFGYMAMAKKQKEGLLPGGLDVRQNIPVKAGEKYAITFRFTPPLSAAQLTQWNAAYRAGMVGTADIGAIAQAPTPGVLTIVLAYLKDTVIHTAPFMMGTIRGETIDVRRVPSGTMIPGVD